METQIIYGTANTIYFPMIVAGGTNFATISTWPTPAATDAKYSIDGGSWTQCTNTVAIAVTGASLWKLTLTAAECSGSRIAIAIVDSATKAVEDQCIICTTQFSSQLESVKGIPIRVVDTGTFTATTVALEATAISSQAVEATADHYNGRLILFTSGTLRGQMSDVTDYVTANSKEKFTYTAVTEAPIAGDRFVII